MLGVEKGGGGPTAPSVHRKNSADQWLGIDYS